MHKFAQAGNSWCKSLEDVVRENRPTRVIRAANVMPFAPTQANNPGSYSRKPVVIVVLTKDTERLHRPLCEALDLLQKSTERFRVVLFTDARSNAVYKDLDWPVEHILSEDQWIKLKSPNWLTMATRRLEWAVGAYGASAMVAVREVDDTRGELMRLGRAFGIRSELLNAALRHFNFAVNKEDSLDSGRVVRPRGWLHRLRVGDSGHKGVHSDGRPLVDYHIADDWPLCAVILGDITNVYNPGQTKRTFLQLHDPSNMESGGAWVLAALNAAEAYGAPLIIRRPEVQVPERIDAAAYDEILVPRSGDSTVTISGLPSMHIREPKNMSRAVSRIAAAARMGQALGGR